MHIKSRLTVLTLSLLAVFPGITFAQTAAQKPINLALGSVSSSSGVYAFAVSLSNVALSKICLHIIKRTCPWASN